jgi:hypothetical protein
LEKILEISLLLELLYHIKAEYYPAVDCLIINSVSNVLVIGFQVLISVLIKWSSISAAVSPILYSFTLS